MKSGLETLIEVMIAKKLRRIADDLWHMAEHGYLAKNAYWRDERQELEKLKTLSSHLHALATRLEEKP